MGEAVISPCGTYRYRLRRDFEPHEIGSPRALFIMLNPSTADAEQDDPTIRRCIGFAKKWGCSGMSVVNLFALRSTDPSALAAHPDPVGPDNDHYILRAVGSHHIFVAAWGAHRFAEERARFVLGMLRHVRVNCLGRTKAGAPRHPLYVPGAQMLEEITL